MLRSVLFAIFKLKYKIQTFILSITIADGAYVAF